MRSVTAPAGNPAAEEIARLRQRLSPERPQPQLAAQIAACECSEAARAGLHLLNGDWDAAHKVAQSLDTPLGAHWHALAHRHEPDFANSKYWYAQVGDSPIFPQLAQVALAAGHEELLRNSKWDPARFTDRYADSANASWTRPLDALEQRLLLDLSLVHRS